MDQNRVGSPQGLVKISVVVPAYNAAATLGDCLEALLTQTVSGTEYEVIVVDDGSTDGTAEVVKQFIAGSAPCASADMEGGNKRSLATNSRSIAKVILLSQPHRGAAAARNLGAQHAQGNIILFTDADCVPTRSWIEVMQRAFTDPEIVGVKGTCQSRQSSLIARFAQIEYEDKYDRMSKYERIDFIDTGSAGYRRRVLLESGGFDETFPSATVEDQELSFRLAEKGYRLVFVPQAVVYHPHPESLISYARRKFRIGYWKVLAMKLHPAKMLNDSHTPQVMKVQIALVSLLGGVGMASLAWTSLRGVLVVLLGLLWLTAIPFSLRVARKDLAVSLITPLMILVRAVSLAAGWWAGVIAVIGKPRRLL